MEHMDLQRARRRFTTVSDTKSSGVVWLYDERAVHFDSDMDHLDRVVRVMDLDWRTCAQVPPFE